MSNKTLGIILGALIIIFAASQFFKTNKNRSFDPQILTFNQDEVNSLQFTSPDGSESTASRKGEEWVVSNGEKEYLADEFAISSVLGELKSLKAKKVAGRSDERAKSFETDAESATRITAKKDDNVLADINIGRFSFDQQTRKPISYVKLANKDETYLEETFVAMSAKKDFNSLRDKTFLSVEKADIQSINISSPTIQETISLTNDDWVSSAGVSLDSLKINNYLDQLRDLKGTTFSVQEATGIPSHTLSISLTDGHIINLNATAIDEEKYELKSSSHPANIFESNGQGMFKKVFTELEELLLIGEG